MLKKFLKEIFKCKHKNAILHTDEGYCPDCGHYVRKAYYIVRCSCCGIKRTAKKHFDTVYPTEKFCTNCGESAYIVEKYDKLNLVDINYAIQVKETSAQAGETTEIEVWVETEGKTKEKPFEKTPLLTNMKYITG